jgi:hypothetical protein
LREDRIIDVADPDGNDRLALREFPIKEDAGSDGPISS